MNCICCSKNLDTSNVIESISVIELNEMYLKSFGIDIRKYFNTNVIDCYKCDVCDLRFFSPVPNVDEKFYEVLSKFDWYYPIDKFEFDFVAKFINENCSNVLEVGAGRGSFAKLLNQKVEYTGLEFNDNAVDLANKAGVNVVKKSMEQLKAELSKPYDAVISFQVLEHVSSPNQFLTEQLSLLKTGGFLVVAVPAFNSFFQYLPNQILDLPPHHLSRWSDNCLYKLQQIFQLKVVHLEKETIQQFHIRLKLHDSIRSKFVSNTKMIRTDFKFKIANKIAAILTKFAFPVMKDKLSKTEGGHVVVVYQKL